MFCFLAFFSSTVAMIRLRSGWQMTNFSECNKIETKERCPWVDLNLTAYYQIYWSVSEEVLLTLKRKTILNTRKNCCLLLLLHHYISSFQKDGKRKWSFSPNNLRYLQMTGPERGKGPKKDGRQPHGLIFWFFYLHVFLVVFSSRESDGVMKKE